MSKVLITGGSGHLGSLLTKHLQNKEHDVWVLDTKFPDHHTNPNESNLDHLYQYLPFDINLSISDPRTVFKLTSSLKRFPVDS